MALKVLMLRKRIDDARKALEELRAKDAEFEAREAEIRTAIDEAQTDEERGTVEEAVEKFDGDKEAHETAKGDLERTIEGLENDLAAAEAEQETPAPTPEPEKREEKRPMDNRTKFFGMNIQERDAFIAREDVQ